MFKIGITGSIASGKTTASQIISRRRGALFSADKVVRNLYKNFNKTIFIKSNRKSRLKRYRLKGGNKKLFSLLDSRQIKDVKKMTLCDHVVVNNKSLSILKKKLLIIISKYE